MAFFNRDKKDSEQGGRKLPERYTGVWNGQEVSLVKELYGHEFTEEERQVLLDGGIVEFVSSEDDRMVKSCAVEVAEREYKGRVAPGYSVLFNCTLFKNDNTEKVSWRTEDGWLGFRRTWGGHRFTAGEVIRLMAGETIKINYTTKKGAEAEAEGRLDYYEYNGRKYFGFVSDYRR